MFNDKKNVNYFNYMPELVGNKNTFDENKNDYFTPIMALSYGNLSKSLYKGYKNYKPVILSAENPLSLLQAYEFIILDLGLYLDVNPTDEDAIKLYNAYIIEYRNLVERFEKYNYPMDKNYLNSPTNYFKWVNNWQLKGGNR